MSILITGGMGFIGGWLARELVGRGEEVVLFDAVMSTDRIRDIKHKVKLIQGDLTLLPEILDVIKGNKVHGIYHLGTMTSLTSEAKPWQAFQVNAVGTLNILEAARVFEVDRVIFTSTADTFGEDIGDKLTDFTIQRPISMYGCSKATGEILGRWYRRARAVDFRGIRICASVMGPGVRTWATSQYNPWMIEAAARGKAYEVYVTPETRLPVMYIKDIVSSLTMLYDAPYEQIKTVIYNVGGAPSSTAKELEMAIRRHIPEAQITYKPDPAVVKMLSEQFQVGVDDSRAFEEFGWDAKYRDLDKLIEDFIAEVRHHPEFYEG